jgi:hypothetical protein
VKKILNKHKRGLAFLIFFLILLFPIRTFAHNAYFLQVLIDDHRFQYIGSVVEDNASYFETESKHLEKELGKFGGLDQKVHPKKDDYEKYVKDKNLTDDIMTFTFSPTEISGWYGNAKNHATSEDVNKAYKAQENLMAGLNDALRIVNGGKDFTSVEKMIDKGEALATAMNNASGAGTAKLGDYTINVNVKKLPGEPQKGFTEKDYMYIKDKDGNIYEFIFRSKKGYVATGEGSKADAQDEYKKDTSYITWNQLMFQANYAYKVHGYNLKTGAELSKPGPVEEAVVSMLGNTFNQLRNLLGLYDINDLVFNEGIRGSSAWTHGIMSKQWSEKAIAYHWIFQALAWSVITFAIVKNLVQRNFATINPAMRLSLMESVQDLLITGVLLANAIPVINMFMYLNAKLVAVFASTAPDFANLAELNAYSNMLGGILIQFFYLGVSIYLNFVYIMRAITIAILIASAPLFIVSIAFGGKWKQLFNTWMKELIGNIFLQSFHAFMLSFFFAISTSSRGIEGMIVLMALIPMTEFFRTMVMGQGGGISHSMGMKSMAQAGSLVGGALSTATGSGGKAKQNGTSTGGGSGREKSTTSANDSGMGNFAGNSDKIKNNSEAMNQRQRMNSTKQAMGNREKPVHVAENPNHKDHALYSNDGLQTKPEGFGQTVRDKIEGAQEGLAKAKETFDNNAGVRVAKGVAKTAIGATQVAVGVGTAMAMGMENPKMAQGALKTAGAGRDLFKEGRAQAGQGAMDMLPESTKAYATTLPNGDMQIHRNASAMRSEGVVGATMEGTQKAPIAKYTYDTSTMPKAELKNLQHAYGAYQSNNQEAKDHYKAQGIDNISYNGNGQMVVRYNQTGMDKMGIKSVQTIGGGGPNARIVETKASNAPNTLRTIPVERYQPIGTQQTQNTGTKNPV